MSPVTFVAYISDTTNSIYVINLNVTGASNVINVTNGSDLLMLLLLLMFLTDDNVADFNVTGASDVINVPNGSVLLMLLIFYKHTGQSQVGLDTCREMPEHLPSAR